MLSPHKGGNHKSSNIISQVLQYQVSSQYTESSIKYHVSVLSIMYQVLLTYQYRVIGVSSSIKCQVSVSSRIRHRY